MYYLLDTNICIYIIKKKPAEVFEKFKNLAIGDVGISSITLAELQYGIEKSSNSLKNREALEKFLTPIEIIDFGHKATFEYGIIRAELEKKGIPIGSLDTLIASHAKSLDVILVTNNVREFERIPGLKIENWTK
ncbi:MAG: type II toxin-antitoxin system VapC family toxin [Prolixibacteraceae bacterium]|jgi:tRNA(fMet)-specific endonuclease VapC|nr:type II toxin-antitoxin system VapC family toxin [Prolixibacteraceae bacterium]